MCTQQPKLRAPSRCWFVLVIILLILSSLIGCRKKPELVIVLDGRGSGHIFEGIGAVSAGASSRLLIDYPEPYRSQVLDYLFKPHYGAALQHLKVEIGADVNSTDGSEPSHMRSRSDQDYNRGYEWWLMKEAKARNPQIILDSLAWGAPGWIGNGKFYSPDMADYVVKFIQGAKRAQGLDIDYTGVWNESRYEIPYVKLLKKALLGNVPSTRLVCCDLYPSENQWSIIGDMQKDPELKSAVDVVSVHYPREKGRLTTPPPAREIGKPLWSSEDQPLTEDSMPNTRDWASGGRILARLYNTNYIDGGFTKTETWSPVTSYYDDLAAPHSGLMYANTPWSGYYRVQSAIWVTAHTTQFAHPGWQYIDSACGHLPGQGSYVTLKSPSSSDYSVIIETIGANTAQLVGFRITGDLSGGPVHVWETNAAKNFEHVMDLHPEGGAFELTLEPDSLYSLTTTTGQGKGTATPPTARPFPFPYEENFESTPDGRSPRYLADQDGAFEVWPCTNRKGRCLRQVINKQPIPWGPIPDPYTYSGDSGWTDYSLSADAMLLQPGDFTVMGRIDSADVFQDGKAPYPSGYVLRVRNDGTWELLNNKYKVPTAKLATGKVAFSLKSWHQLRLSFNGPHIEAFVDGKSVAKVDDSTHRSGMAGIGAGWNLAEFDNLAVR
ncbi:MAG: galactosylceramidase [Acidobacteriia bacterium]|nr:galactosylceramidase [Terriglobia bacterium]